MSKKSKALKRRKLFAHQEAVVTTPYNPAGAGAFLPPLQPNTGKSIVGVVAHEDKRPTRVMDENGYPVDMNDQDIGIHRNEGP